MPSPRHLTKCEGGRREISSSGEMVSMRCGPSVKCQIHRAVCTHLGCTPDWKPSENKFKCPCHGSGYDAEGINFEGPAPWPMDRAHVELDPEGQIVVDVSHLYSWPKGERSQFNDPGAILRV